MSFHDREMTVSSGYAKDLSQLRINGFLELTLNSWLAIHRDISRTADAGNQRVENSGRKKMVGLAAHRDAIAILCWASVSERGACEVVGAPRSTVRYLPRKIADDRIRMRLEELAAERPRLPWQCFHRS